MRAGTEAGALYFFKAGGSTAKRNMRGEAEYAEPAAGRHGVCQGNGSDAIFFV